MSKSINMQKIVKNEQGIVAITVSVLLILMMSLIVLAISQNARREQRQSLDRQLSDQAFYNAESGINDVVKYLFDNPNAIVERASCDTPTTPALPSPNLDAGGTNKYTCALWNKAPKTIKYDNVSISQPKVIPIKTVNDAAIDTNIRELTISWDDTTDRNAAITGDCNFTTAGSPVLPTECSHAAVRAELVIPGSNRDEIRTQGFSAFLLPAIGTGADLNVGSIAYPDNEGVITSTRCEATAPATTRRCSKKFTGLNRNNFFLSLRSLYRPANISIEGSSATGTALRFKDTQVLIDVTGKANDILRRVQVRVPATSQYSYPGFGLQSKDSICKVLVVSQTDPSPGNVATDDATNCPIN
jgi:Tfp pilus assembly protein PilX